MKRLLVITVVMVCMVIPLSSLAQKVGGGDLTFSPKNTSPVVFSHEKHVNGKGVKCSGCHYHVFQMEKGSYKMDMIKITKGDFCGKCHNGRKAFDVKDQKNCSLCHRQS
jgi:c(7)-type cytochrome triheme protein